MAGKTKIDMATLIQQGMIFVALPNPDRVSITDCANWLYVSVDLDTKEGYNAENMVAGEQMNED